jgi:hypothetical protein
MEILPCGSTQLCDHRGARRVGTPAAAGGRVTSIAHPQTNRRLPAVDDEDPSLLFIARAGRLARIDGRRVLRLAANPATQLLYDRSTHARAA